MGRSYLFTPAHQDRLLARAHERGADVVLLDLEDSVPPAEKPRARAGLAAAVAGLVARRARVAVRVNAGLHILGAEEERVDAGGFRGQRGGRAEIGVECRRGQDRIIRRFSGSVS